MEENIRVTWARDSHPLMQFELECRDEEAAWRVFQRLCGILRALLNAEQRQIEQMTGMERRES